MTGILIADDDRISRRLLQAASLVVAERMRSAAASVSTARQTGAVAVTISIGPASCTAGRTDASALIARADEALYRAKHGGRNRVEAAPQADAICATTNRRAALVTGGEK